jgi:hypothetical protein
MMVRPNKTKPEGYMWPLDVPSGRRQFPHACKAQTPRDPGFRGGPPQNPGGPIHGFFWRVGIRCSWLTVRCADSIRRLISARQIRYQPQLPPFTSLFHIYADLASELPRPAALRLEVVERWRS